MIYVDDRQGAKELVPHLEQRGHPVTLERMDFGDIRFFGEGPDFAMWHIGIECKSFEEIVDDFQTPRFTGYQLPGMTAAYDRRYLVVKGSIRLRKGAIQVPRGAQWKGVQVGGRPLTYAMYRAKLLTFEEHTGLSVIQVDTTQEQVLAIESLYRWWNHVGFEGHGSLRQFYLPRHSGGVKPPSRYRHALKALIPGMGWQRTETLEAAYPSLESLMDADISDLASLPGLGPKVAKSIYDALHT